MYRYKNYVEGLGVINNSAEPGVTHNWLQLNDNWKDKEQKLFSDHHGRKWKNIWG